MHAGNLGHGVLKPRSISINIVIGELLLSLVEELVLAGYLSHQLAKLYLLLSRPLLESGHLSLRLLSFFLQVNNLFSEIQDLSMGAQRLLGLLK